MHRQALGLRETVLGKEHPDTLTSVYCLAYLLHLQQRLSEAGPLYQRALTGYEKTLGSDHPTTQACRKHYLYPRVWTISTSKRDTEQSQKYGISDSRSIGNSYL